MTLLLWLAWGIPALICWRPFAGAFAYSEANTHRRQTPSWADWAAGMVIGGVCAACWPLGAVPLGKYLPALFTLGEERKVCQRIKEQTARQRLHESELERERLQRLVDQFERGQL